MPVESDPIDVVVPPSPITQELDGAGDAIIGLVPLPPSSVAPSGIEPTDAVPGAAPAFIPLKLDAAPVVPDAVPPAPQDPSEVVPEPIVFVFMPAPSKVEAEPVVPVPDRPVPAHGSVLTVGSSGAGLRPPGVSSLEPSGIPTGPTDDVAPSTPKGDVAPMAGLAGVSGAI
ncbi:MAG TPA: hypothetical protein VGJ20_12915 [Xanthobacteraceae bacterium]